MGQDRTEEGGRVDGWNAVLSLLPDELERALRRLPPSVRAQVQELRLRAGQAVALGIRGEERYVTAGGVVTVQADAALRCEERWLRQVIDRVCEHSVYAHQEELKRGFLPAPDGCRIGIAGTAVVENGEIISYRGMTSLCIRVAREHRGCAEALAARLCADDVAGALICGEPSSGKTSLLRDLLRQFSARRLSVAVIDERGELTGGGLPTGCDSLRGAPKALGVEQAIRCLSPRVVVFDELGGARELEAVRQALYSGVPVVASVHCRRPEELLHREGLATVLRGGAFSYLVQLHGAEAPGEIAAVRRVEEWLYETVGDTAGLSDRHRMRTAGLYEPEASLGFARAHHSIL